MDLLLTVCLTWTLLYTADSLNCHRCANQLCSNSTSVECPALSTVCRTITSVRLTGSFTAVTVNKNCSSLLSCITPLNTETEWSVNNGYAREAHTQLCCNTDDCNLPTVATPSTFSNGKQCPGCATENDSLAGTCNATVSCAGVEDRCFNGTITSNSTEVLQLGCISRNLCSSQIILQVLFGENSKLTCGAPWSVRISAVLLTFALTVHQVLV